MRARNIKPGFFANEDLAEIDPMGRLLFIGLWMLADREGRLEDRPKRLKGTIFPYDNCDIDALLNDLQKYGFILRYEVDGMKCIQIVNFTKHQNPHPKEAQSKLPPPENHVDSGTTTYQVPRSKGGSNEGSNLQTLCMACNSSKGNSLPVESNVISRKASEKQVANHAESLNPESLNPESNNTTTTTTTHTREEEEKEWAEVASTFSNNVHPISGEIEKDRLYDMFQEYGKIWMLASISEAVQSSRGAPSLKYITAILERWKRDGFKSEKHGRAAPSKPRETLDERRERLRRMMGEGVTNGRQGNSA